MPTPSVQECQRPLRARYKTEPAAASITCHARTHPTDLQDPFHAAVVPGAGAPVAVSVHRAAGGPYDAPCPVDLLCAALAACQESSIRMVANGLGVELSALAVEVAADIDIRGALGLDPQVPVGVQALRSEVHMTVREGTPLELLARLRAAAERCCVVQQTLRQPPALQTTFHPA